MPCLFGISNHISVSKIYYKFKLFLTLVISTNYMFKHVIMYLNFINTWSIWDKSIKNIKMPNFGINLNFNYLINTKYIVFPPNCCYQSLIICVFYKCTIYTMFEYLEVCHVNSLIYLWIWFVIGKYIFCNRWLYFWNVLVIYKIHCLPRCSFM